MRGLLGTLLLFAATAPAAPTTATAADAPAAAQDVTPASWTVAYLAAGSTPPERIGQVLELLDGDTGGFPPRALDLLAEYLIRHAANPLLDGVDARKLVEVIDRRGGGRHVTALRAVREQEGSVHLEKAVFAYLVRHESAADGYMPGVIDLAAQRTLHITRALATEASEQRARKLGELARGDTLDRLFDVMGPPQHVASFAMEVHRLRFYYRGAGRVVFGFVKGQGWRLQSVVADPLAFEPEMPYRSRAAELGQPDDATLRMIQLASGAPAAFKMAIDDTLRLLERDATASAPLEFFDRTAEYLAANFRDAKGENEDTLSLIARLLTRYGGSRYTPLLREVASKTNSLKLRKWAKMPLRRSAVSSRTPFVAGAFDTAAFTKKYPSLYPDVTYSSGVL
jgi:hypothetical protein